MEKTYIETRKAIKGLIIANGIDGITGYHIIDLMNDGHNSTNIQNAISYFQYSPQTAQYR